MDIKRIVDSLRDCPCGRAHKADVKAIEIGGGLKAETAKILNKHGFPKKILVVADKNTLRASDGIMEILKEGGFDTELELYDDLRVAEMSECKRLEEICKSRGFEGILSVGSGSLNDICRFAALHADTDFAIFATGGGSDAVGKLHRNAGNNQRFHNRFRGFFGLLGYPFCEIDVFF